jgi:hypothetical protein
LARPQTEQNIMAKTSMAKTSMAKFKVTVPFVDDMGSVSPFIVRESYTETKAQAALWTINSMRDHDGLLHLARMPNGTEYTRVPETTRN